MKEHHRMYTGLSIACLLLAVCITTILIISRTSLLDATTPLTNQNFISPTMQKNSSNNKPVQSINGQIPPPPIVVPIETKESKPILSDEQELITLIESVPFTFHDSTLTLMGFNHKFQDSPSESYVWVDVSAFVNTAPVTVETMVFNEHSFVDEQGVPQLLRTRSAFNGYMFELSDVGYGYSINLTARKILSDS